MRKQTNLAAILKIAPHIFEEIGKDWDEIMLYVIDLSLF